MESFPITIYPEKILRRQAAPIMEIPPSMQQRASAMVETMRENDGVGLAAPQVGISERMIIVQDGERAHAFLNPRIVKKSKEQETEEEGCLSLPGIFVPVKRASGVEVVCQTLAGEEIRLAAEGLLARIFQHEIDHIDGKLIIDRTGWKNRWNVRKELKALEKKS